ncbi:hypothetical protein G6F31_021526 [Rhizopus arrhizus]|nr:hypothetical protein G6F31_021526 [Rhizopus arrhizus]
MPDQSIPSMEVTDSWQVLVKVPWIVRSAVVSAANAGTASEAKAMGRRARRKVLRVMGIVSLRGIEWG